MDIDPIRIFAPPILASIFLLLGWISDKRITRGGPLTSHMKRALIYGFFFVLGLGYLIIWQDELGSLLHWRSAWIFLIVAWGGLLSGVGLSRYRRARTESRDPREQVSGALAQGITAVGLMISIIGAAIEWEYISEGQGRWWLGFLWTGAVALCILAARQNRRSTVVIVLRSVAALLIIGAIAQRTTPSIVAAIVIALTLLLLEKFRRNEGPT